MKFYITILIFISLIFSACEDPETKEYIVTGKVVYYQKSLEGVRLEFYRSYPEGYRTFTEYLGSTNCDSNGNYSFSYETDKNRKTLEVEVFKGNEKLKYIKDLPFASNWIKELNVSDSAFVEFIFNSDNPLALGDTLFIGIPGSSISILGPLINGSRDTFTVRNAVQSISWISNQSAQTDRGSIGYYPTGAPNIDVIQINYQNKH